MKDALFVDFNGTLSDDEPLLARIYAEMIDGLTVEGYFARYLGWTDEAIFRDAFGRDDVDALIAERVDRYCTETAGGQTIHDSARDAMAWAAARVPVVVVTSAFRREVEAGLAAAGLDLVLVTIEDVAAPKPAAEPYARACELVAVAPGSAVAIEDSTTGVEAARAAGVECVQLGVDITSLDRDTVERLLER